MQKNEMTTGDAFDLVRRSLPTKWHLKRLEAEALKVLWIDTEQSQQSTQEIMKDRIICVTEHPDTKDSWVEICDHSLFDSQEGVPF